MNSLTLYKVDWAVGSNPQPFFGDEDWRTNYFNSAPSKSVNAAGVNIKFSPEFTADFVVNVDYTAIEGYNYIIANYNNKTYYMHINTYESISLGFSKIYCTRDFFTEYVNFFQYFNNFRIYKTNIYPKIFDENTGYLHNFTYRTKFSSLSTAVSNHASSPVKYNKFAYPCPFLMLIINDASQLNGVEVFTMNYTPTNYYIILLPLSFTNVHYFVYNEISYEEKYYMAKIEDCVSLLNHLSPNIISYNFVYLYIYTNNSVGLGGDIYLYEGIDQCYVTIGEEKYYLFYMKYHHNMADNYEAFRTYFSFDVEVSNFLDKIHLLVGQPDFKVDLNMYDYYNSDSLSYKLTVYFYYTFSDEGVTITLQITAPNTLNEAYTTYYFTYDFLSSVTFVVDQTTATMLQNKYYSQITAVNKNLKKDLGDWEQTESAVNGVISGITSIMGGAVTGNMEGVYKGIGSIGTGIVSGVASKAKSELEADAYAQVRDLELKNEMAKPPQVNVSENALASSYIMKGKFAILKEEPYNVDQNYINNKFNCEGFDINRFEETRLPISDYLMNNNSFYMKCDCDNNSKLPTYIVNYFRDILKTGCRFKAFGKPV